MNAMKLAIPLFVALAYGPSQGLAVPIPLGASLVTFAVLGAEAGVTNVPTSTIGGNLGATNASIGTGYSFTFGGSAQPNTSLAQAAQIDLDALILAVNAFGPGTTLLTSAILGNLDLFQAANGGTIAPGTYTVPAQFENLTGALILNGGGSNTARWVFQFPSTLITSTTSTVTVINVGDGAGVELYWNVHSAATLNGLTFEGNVVAHDLISSDGDLTISCGRLLSAETQVTLIHDKISIGCAGFGQSVPEPATLLLFGFGLAGLFTFRKRLLPVA